ncbi:MAG: hypothetical protein ABW252_20105, partial [Polyangiales bacterium]
RALCIRHAREPLTRLARTLLSADRDEQQTTIALEAVRALAALGGDARAAGAALVGEASSPELTTLWSKLPAARCERPDA